MPPYDKLSVSVRRARPADMSGSLTLDPRIFMSRPGSSFSHLISRRNMLVRSQRGSGSTPPAFTWLGRHVPASRSLLGSAIATAMLFLLMACTTPEVTLAQGARQYTPSDYERVLSRWTRSEDLITLRALDNLLTVTATFESWDFRWAYSVR